MPSAVVADPLRGVEEGVVFMGVAFRELPSGAPSGDYLSRAVVVCGGAPTADPACMGLTSCL